MNRVLFFSVFLFAITMCLQAQRIDVPVVGGSSDPYQELLLPPAVVAADDVLNERIVDLVDVWTVDSTYTRKTAVHRSLFFPIVRMFGVRWKTVRYTREKYVGTVSHQRIPGADAERFTEYDVNFDPVAHLPHHRQLAHDGHVAQADMFKSRKRTRGRTDEEPFILPDEVRHPERYRIHCEVTPDGPSRTALNDLFYPTIAPMSTATHPNILQENPTIGLYGCFVLDCNHKCHPEIHPYEWFWWYDVRPQANVLDRRTWFVALFRDVSNRMKHWSSSPRVGQMRIPFVMPAAATGKTIDIEHLVYDGFVPDAMGRMDIPDDALDARRTERTLVLDSDALEVYPALTVRMNHAIDSDGIRMWLDHVAYDDRTGMLSGVLVLALSVEDVYTARITTSHSLR